MPVILDSPEFTHQVAKRVRRRTPNIPIIDYVSPSVWAWRPAGPARCGALSTTSSPFCPSSLRRISDSAALPAAYVGHPLVEQLDWMQSLNSEAVRRRLGTPKDRAVLVVLPGSRASEVKRLMAPFGDALRRLQAEAGPFEVILPAVQSTFAR